MRHDVWSDFSGRCARILSSLRTGRPQTVEELCRTISEQRGRGLTLSPLPAGAGESGGVCGLLVSLGDADHIFYESSTNRLHQRHIILHEIAHLLLDHGSTAGEGAASGLERLFPGLDPAMVRRLLARGRTDYSQVQEREAELLATLIHRRTTGPVADGAGTALSELQRILAPDTRR
ncbi:hypothetical protein [Streptomyces sp. NPDC056527]|uniref:hypothetical protein n=1 Tax=Streptomyces sp. NPDC056527 TaxID=3345853 RepID=UPI003682E9B6